MNNFTFCVPTKIHFGKDQISHLAELTESGKRVLMVYGGGSIKKSGIYDKAVSVMTEAGLEICELSGVEPNPRIESVREGVQTCKAHDIDMVLAIGGGSVIDCSKVIAAGAKYDGDPWDLVLDPSKVKAALPVYSVLTIAATGSEMDPFAVISDLTKNEKWATFSPNFTPKMSILDPTYTFSVSPKQTAAGVADMMSHTLENYFTQANGFLQARLCEAILKTCIKFGPVAYKQPKNYEARANLMWASSWAINGLLNSGCEVAWCVHPMEHELSAFYDITHGQGLAILTPVWMTFALGDDTVEKFAEYGVNVWGLKPDEDPYKTAKIAIKLTYDFFKNELEIPMTLREVGIPDQTNFEIMAKKAADGCKGSYVPLDEDAISAIFKAAF